MTNEQRAAFVSVAERLHGLAGELASIIETMPPDDRGRLSWVMYALGGVRAELQMWIEGRRP